MRDSRDIQEINEAFEQVNKTIDSGHFESANKTINKLYLKSLKIKYNEGENIYFEKKILLLLYTGKYFKTIPLIQHLIKTYEERNDLGKLSSVYGKFGTILSKLKDYKSGEFYLKKALKLSLNLNPIHAKSVITWYTQLANNYSAKDKPIKALEQIKLGLKFAKNYDGEEGHKYFLKILELEYLTDLNRLKKAEKLFHEIEKDKTHKDKLHKVSYDIIKIHFLNIVSILDSKEFLNLVHSTLKTSFELSNKDYIYMLLKTLKDYHFKNNEKEIAYKYANQIIELKEKESNKEVSILNWQNLKPIGPDEKYDEYEIYYKTELDIAASYQQQFHSKKIKSDKLNIETIYTPSKTLGGDYIGTFKLDNGTYLLVLADVVGKGITASYISFMLDGIIKSLIKSSGTFCLKQNIVDINDVISDTLKNQGFVSLWAGIINTNKKTLESINAGHLPTYIIKKDGNLIKLSKGCTILGMFENMSKPNIEQIEFNRGDSLIAISDGVTETVNKDMN